MRMQLALKRHRKIQRLIIKKCQNRNCQTDRGLGFNWTVVERENGLSLCDVCFYEIHPKELKIR